MNKTADKKALLLAKISSMAVFSGHRTKCDLCIKQRQENQLTNNLITP